MLFPGIRRIFSGKSTAMTKKKPIPSDLRCMECGKPIRNGRSDRKFCSPQCKNRWHNARDGRFYTYRLRILASLDRNHLILTRLHDAGIQSMARADIVSMGFRTDFFTGCSRTGRYLEYACFDFRYRISDNRVWRIARVLPGAGEQRPAPG